MINEEFLQNIIWLLRFHSELQEILLINSKEYVICKNLTESIKCLDSYIFKLLEDKSQELSKQKDY